MTRMPFEFKIYNNSTDFLDDKFHTLRKETSEANYFIVENYRYVGFISEHEILLIYKTPEVDRVKLVRYEDGARITTYAPFIKDTNLYLEEAKSGLTRSDAFALIGLTIEQHLNDASKIYTDNESRDRSN